MLDWAWKPTRHPARSRPSAVVTTISGLSSDDMMLVNASRDIGTSLIAQEQRVSVLTLTAQHMPQ